MATEHKLSKILYLVERSQDCEDLQRTVERLESNVKLRMDAVLEVRGPRCVLNPCVLRGLTLPVCSSSRSACNSEYVYNCNFTKINQTITLVVCQNGNERETKSENARERGAAELVLLFRRFLCRVGKRRASCRWPHLHCGSLICGLWSS